MTWEAAPAAATAGFLGLWCVAAGAMHLVGELISLPLTPQGAVVALTVICVGARLSRRRGAMLNACALTRPMRAGRPLRGGVVWGTKAVGRSVRVCAAPISLMALSPALPIAAMITALLWRERFSVRRPNLRAPLALSYAAVGAAMVLGVAQ